MLLLVDSNGTQQRLSPWKSLTVHFVPSFMLFTWHGLWGGNGNALYHHLCDFGDWHGYFHLQEVSIPHQRGPFMKGASSEVLPEQMFLNDSFRASTFLCQTTWHKASCQVTQSHLSASQGWDEWPSVHWYLLNFCVCAMSPYSARWLHSL